ncbi:ABC transporter ATP-binding protein [Marinomonas rhizomae]|uniref:ABC-type Fe3+/spermidine/putrescine transport system ATPase subunit n=1 Tax=Marinomonas rhizomae TaxID=491948 RepID=A0A366JC29_9GAMM|nr:ABC transporter ATP-binding protein [Marinomonas rhizomae]RBP83929.1 ABC-type Fe3+/spermidine/putrescine transport system ATPase subunit [Marinomonas rhizomae]RNF73368.1 ABC transporter ATP-binding protein [Marinomonas rhizomae]
MAHLHIKNLQAGYGKKMILDNINLTVEQGEMIALLGPSGCGKTTLLNALCGFVPVSNGEIFAGDRAVSQLPAEKRNITMVFQSYALWPHMTVAQNIGYGLKVQKAKRVEIENRVTELLNIVKLEGLEDEKVTALSGGQRQRVALARALAIRPDVLVLDEPLSNLDAKVRLSVRHEIKALQKQLGFTSLIVTHDQEEALVMADRIAVLNQGKIEQIGTPEEIYHHPSTPFVADFMGAENHIEWPTNDDAFHLSLNNHAAPLDIYFRSENAVLSTQPSAIKDDFHTGLVINGHVAQSVFFGNNYQISVRCGKHTIQADHDQNLPEHTPVTLRVPIDALYAFTKNEKHSEHQKNHAVSV